LDTTGLTDLASVRWNLTEVELTETAIRRGEGEFTAPRRGRSVPWCPALWRGCAARSRPCRHSFVCAPRPGRSRSSAPVNTALHHVEQAAFL
ncbi:MAG: hypothetical protein EOP19_06935, partial [Hyphomicrobiales bacterium]